MMGRQRRMYDCSEMDPATGQHRRGISLVAGSSAQGKDDMDVPPALKQRRHASLFSRSFTATCPERDRRAQDNLSEDFPIAPVLMPVRYQARV